MIDNSILSTLPELQQRIRDLSEIFAYASKKQRLEEILITLEDQSVWNDQTKVQNLSKERAQLEAMIRQIDDINHDYNDITELLAMAMAEQDKATITELEHNTQDLIKRLEALELQKMFSGPLDKSNAYLDIQAGAGGTEAQDWAEMLLRMYLRFGDRHGFAPQLLEVSPGDVAGIKSATIKFTGEYAYGWLNTETGVHRLVRKSPFDANNKRHTSFASAFVYPEVDDTIEIAINPADLRIDTYRAQGAGGQHVNKTDSAVRIKHNPSGIIVSCQSERSQHQNRAQAMQQLRAKLYELELRKKQAAQDALESAKSDIGWGSQIRSYVLDDSRVKDLRTGTETRNPLPVLDGHIDMFIIANLKHNR